MAGSCGSARRVVTVLASELRPGSITLGVRVGLRREREVLLARLRERSSICMGLLEVLEGLGGGTPKAGSVPGG